MSIQKNKKDILNELIENFVSDYPDTKMMYDFNYGSVINDIIIGDELRYKLIKHNVSLASLLLFRLHLCQGQYESAEYMKNTIISEII